MAFSCKLGPSRAGDGARVEGAGVWESPLHVHEPPRL